MSDPGAGLPPEPEIAELVKLVDGLALVGQSTKDALIGGIERLARELAQAERERDTALYDAKGCAKASLMIAGDFAKAETRAERLEAAVHKRIKAGHSDTCQSVLITDAPYPCNCGHDGLREALSAEPSPRAEARQDGALDPEMPR